MAIQTNPPVAAFVGDTVSNWYFDANVLFDTAISMTSMANGEFLGINLSAGDATAQSVRYGAGAWTHGPFASAVSLFPAKYYVIRLGWNEAMRRQANISGGWSYPHPIADIKINLKSLIASARAAGRKPVLCTYPIYPNSPSPATPTAPLAYDAATQTRLTQANTAIAQTSTEENVPLIDVRSHVIPAAQMFDHLHPGPVASHNVGKAIGSQLRTIIATY